MLKDLEQAIKTRDWEVKHSGPTPRGRGASDAMTAVIAVPSKTNASNVLILKLKYRMDNL